ncbi:MAG: type II secretion system protein [Planctomycetota bacterium]
MNSFQSRYNDRPEATPLTPRDHGFTLIKLLVLISIIALLIGIFLPALGAARDSARGVKCLANLKQMGFASLAYADENKGLLPHGYLFDASGSDVSGWDTSKPGVTPDG